MEQSFLRLMPHQVTIETVESRDSWGAVTWDADATTARALVVPGRRLVVTTQGQEVAARGVAHVAGPVTVSEESHITVPTEFGFPERMQVVSVRIFSDDTGDVHNVEVAF